MTAVEAARSWTARRRRPARMLRSDIAASAAAAHGHAASPSNGSAFTTDRHSARPKPTLRPLASIVRKPSSRLPGDACHGDASNAAHHNTTAAAASGTDSRARSTAGVKSRASRKNAAPRLGRAAYSSGIEVKLNPLNH